MMSTKRVSVMTRVLGKERKKKPLPKYQQVVRSWKVVQDPAFRESVVLECSGKCERQAKQDGLYVLVVFPASRL